MNSYIEPRLLALLQHEALEPYALASLELPPLQDPNIIQASGRPLLLEPDASKRSGETNSRSHLAPKHGHLLSSIDDQESAYKINEAKQKYGDSTTDRALGGSSPQSLRKILDDDTEQTLGASLKKRQVELGKDDFVQLPQPPKKQKVVVPLSVPPMINGIHELPAKAAMLPMLPPIASSSFHDSHGRNSLNTLPPKALALEINTGNPSAHDVLRNEADEEHEQDQTNDLSEHNTRIELGELNPPNDVFEDTARNELYRPSELPNNSTRDELDGLADSHPSNSLEPPEPHQVKKRRTNRKRRPWFQEENDALMLGVQKHGVGNWTDILKDPNFSNAFRCKDPGGKDRTAADLKDRFRTYCPPELRGKPPSKIPPKKSTRKEKPLPSLVYENIMINNQEVRVLFAHRRGPPNQGRSRAHRAELDDLAELGIKAPFVQSSRRERRNFTQEEDAAILQGWHEHGAQWSRIQRDPRFSLQARTPTDLRDRFRNRYRDLFEQQQKPKGKSTSAQQPSKRSSSKPRGKDGLSSSPQPPSLQPLSSRDGLRIQEIISSDQPPSQSVPLQQHNPIYGFKDTFNSYAEQQSIDGLPFTQSQDWDGGIAAPFSNTHEVEIPRILPSEIASWQNDLGEGGQDGMQGVGGKEKQTFTDINSILSSNAEPIHNLPSFLNMLNHDGPIEDMNEPTF